MKIFLIGVMLLAGIQVNANIQDTTVTSFEIHLKRKSSDETIGFNTTAIDRNKLYNTVIQQLQGKLSAEAFCSLYQPMVVLKFNEYTEKGRYDEISFGEERSLKSHRYNYFVKIYGQLNACTPLDPFHKATFTLKVCVFDAQGRLVAKGKSKASGKNLQELTKVQPADPDHPMTEEDFIGLVRDAATTLQITI